MTTRDSGTRASSGTGNASVLVGNSFKSDGVEALPPRARDLLQRRTRSLGPGYRLFYQEPVEVVRGRGARLWDSEGNEYLDLYNNVASIGHAHPRVVEAVARQLSQVATHTRYLHEAIIGYAEDLLSTMPGEIDQLMVVCTGSEANDLALRVGREFTGGTAYIATSEGYHGNTALVTAHSPALSGVERMDPALRVVEPPNTFRFGFDDAGARFLAEVEAAIESIEASGDRLAGLIADTSFSSDGIYLGRPGMITAAIELVQSRGGVFIADEVQPGFARTGEAFWGFARHGLTPDIVTTGKPMGNGLAIAGMAARSEVLAPFAECRPYFNTFGGNPVAVIAAQTVLDVIRDEGLQEHALTTGAAMRAALLGLQDAHPAVGDVRGAGLYTGLELVDPADQTTPATSLALAVIEDLRERRVLTSVCGPNNNVLKLRPPLAFNPSDIARLTDALDASLTSLGQ